MQLTIEIYVNRLKGINKRPAGGFIKQPIVFATLAPAFWQFVAMSFEETSNGTGPDIVQVCDLQITIQ
ncbi:hypothetical protein GCM10009109_31900 [Marinobacterium sediminicola]